MLIFFVGYFINDKFGFRAQEVVIEYGDDFPDLRVLDSGENMCNLNDKLTNQVNLICYVSKYCSICIEELSLINKLFCTREVNENINIVLLWEDEIPANRILEKNIEMKFNFSLNSEYALGNNTPCFYFVENGVVSFKTSDTEKLINRLFEYADIDGLRKSAISVLKEECDKNNSYFAFVTESCEECLEIENINNRKDVCFVFDYTKKNGIVDKYGFYQQVFNIVRYPTLLKITDEGYEVIEDSEMIRNELQ